MMFIILLRLIILTWSRVCIIRISVMLIILLVMVRLLLLMSLWVECRLVGVGWMGRIRWLRLRRVRWLSVRIRCLF